jgi:S1/P1 Nuclease
VQKDVLFAKHAALAATLLLYSPSALAWGGLGHEAVCELAVRELDDTARQRVIALIQQDDEFTTFRASCNWADKPRPRAHEHFVNLPRDATGLDGDVCPMAEECAVSAIEDDFAVLASSDATDDEKLAALKFLGHWVGDIHQPLHAASQDDRGGNHIRTQGSSCESLHTLWDRCIVEERIGMHPLTIVRELRAGITDEQRADWMAATRWTGPTSRSRSPVSPSSGTASWWVIPASTRPTTWSSTKASPSVWSWSTTAIWTGTLQSRGNGS